MTDYEKLQRLYNEVESLSTAKKRLAMMKNIKFGKLRQEGSLRTHLGKIVRYMIILKK